ncbi:MAG TPA: glycosyltransferase [Planctomycetaceae bacterium]|jgi:glycosyltransferase involved in cell wall biosynthesis
MSNERLIIHAPNVHTGGGRVLLTELLASLSPYVRGAAILDGRLELPFALPDDMVETRVSPSLRDRLRAERLLAQTADDDSQILCFGNLPPLMRCRGKVSVFLHNRHLVSQTDLSGFSLRARLRLRAERAWIRIYAPRVDEWIVQTESMRLLVANRVGIDTRIRVLPFVTDLSQAAGDKRDPTERPLEQVDFCYVASGEPHKNHRKLIEAWVLMSQEGLLPTLRLTLDRREECELCSWIEAQKLRFGLRIDNVGRVPPHKIPRVYRSSRCEIHPSWCESFGLPLIEAKGFGLSIVAAELDYVRDVVVPDETFDPHSARSIARAVARFLGRPAVMPQLPSGKFFLSQLAIPEGVGPNAERRAFAISESPSAGSAPGADAVPELIRS